MSFKTPDITVAQVVSGVPVIANLLAVFGVYHLSKGQTDALQATLLWSAALLFADGIIRHGRSKVAAARQEATTINQAFGVPPQND